MPDTKWAYVVKEKTSASRKTEIQARKPCKNQRFNPKQEAKDSIDAVQKFKMLRPGDNWQLWKMESM